MTDETHNDDTQDPSHTEGASSPAPVQSKLSIDTPAKRAAGVKRKWLIVGAGVFASVTLLSSMLSGPSIRPAAPPRKSEAFNLTPPSVLRESFHAQTQASIQALGGRTHKQQAEIAAILRQLKDQHAQHASDQQRLMAQLSKLEGSIAQLKMRERRVEASVSHPRMPGRGNMQALPQNPPGTGAPQYDRYAPPPAPGAANSSGLTTVPTPTANTKPVVLVPPGARSATTAATVTYAPNPYAGYIPSGAFMPVVLLTGVEAGTASSAQSNPEPVLMRVQNLAQLPGYARYRVQTCFVTGSAYGSMSTERAYVRLVSLSCLDKHHKLVLDSPLKGYVVDSDGMFGLRGKLVQRQGALLAKALLAGFAQGLGNAFSMSEGTTTMMMGMGGLGAAQTLSGSQMLRSAGLSGAGSAMQLLAQFYLKQAQSIFPVVVVRPGREATLVLSSGTALHWHRYGPLYVRRVRPK